MNEIWKDIEGYEGYYQVSNLGNVRGVDRICKSNKFIKGIVLKQQTDKDGYKRIGLKKDGKMKRFAVHRLVAIAFIPNVNNYPCINHKNEDKTNNVVENLEWCTVGYNNHFGTRTKRQSMNTDYKRIASKIDYKLLAKIRVEKTSKKVYQYSLEGNLIREYKSPKECNEYGFISQNVVRCCNHKSYSHKGYIWSYQILSIEEIDKIKTKIKLRK